MARRPAAGTRSSADQAEEPAASAQGNSQQVATVAVDQAREEGTAVGDQASRVRGEAVQQGRAVVGEARSQVVAQVQAQVRHLADGLALVGEEVRALSEGRPEDVDRQLPYLGNATDAVDDAADRLYSVAADIDERGLGGVPADVQAFARRRPGAFLVGAAVAGFGLGRAVRASSSSDNELPSPAGRRTR